MPIALVNLKNEIVGMVSNAPRWDVVAYRGVGSIYEVTVEDGAQLTEVTINLYAAADREQLLKTWTPTVIPLTAFRWDIAPGDLVDFKPLIYYVTAIDQDGNLVFWGSFELIGGL